MNIDIIIYAVIALVILARLWSVLGNRSEEDRERPNPFAAPVPPPSDGTGVARPKAGMELPLLLRPLRAAPASLAGGLEQVRAADPAFDEKKFLAEARDTFKTIVTDFAKGDMAQSEKLLAPPVLAHFRAAIEARRNAGQVMETRIDAVKDAETVAAKIDGSRALITVRFTSTQENVLRDGAGRVIGGEAGRLEEITDSWSFARDTGSPNSAWLLAETGA